MKVWAQILYADVDKDGAMFDFHIAFFIVDRQNSALEAFYYFDKVAAKKKGKSEEQSFVGADDATENERKPFKFDELTERGMSQQVDAQVELESWGAGHFAVVVTVQKKKSHSVTMAFQGDKPSWLGEKSVFSGKLMRGEVKDFNAKKKGP
jgi:hypothetical protein